jgi:DNA polymerase
MSTSPQQPLDNSISERDVSAVLAWWADAGVEHGFRDEPEAWLAEPATGSGPAVHSPLETDDRSDARSSSVPRRPAAASPTVVRLGGEAGEWPADLPAFRTWWMTEPSLGEPGAYPRLPPIGPAGADIMLLVPMPEDVDRDELLSGPAGRMAQLLLRAMEVAPASAYLASVLPRHTPLADWNGLASRGLADIVQHHIALAQPRRVLVLGRVIASLFEPDQKVFLGPGLDELQRSAQRRQRFWRSWLEWTGELG